MNDHPREALEMTVVALSQKVINCVDDNRAEDASNFAGALRDACAGLQYLIEADKDT